MSTSVIEGIAAYKARKAEQESAREAASKPRVQKFGLEKDGDSAVVRFAQEIDFDAKGYSEEAGIGFVNLEHTHPDPKLGWRNRGNCTTGSQGACYPCEKRGDSTVEWEDRKGWKTKEKFYVNLVGGEPREVKEKVNGKDVTRYFTTDVNRTTGDGVIYLLDQSTYKGIYDQLTENAVEDETILATFWKITRKGNNFNDTSYTLTKLKEVPAKAKAVSEFELYNIKEDVLREVPYAQQAAFYNRGITGTEDGPSASEDTSSAPASTEETW